MGVDGIGGRGPTGRVTGGETADVSAVAPKAPAGATGAGKTEGAAGSAALEKLERGEISVDQYLDARVGAAVAHLEGTLASSRLEFMKQALRAELASDPVLAELVRRTTGSVPALDRD